MKNRLQIFKIVTFLIGFLILIDYFWPWGLSKDYVIVNKYISAQQSYPVHLIINDSKNVAVVVGAEMAVSALIGDKLNIRFSPVFKIAKKRVLHRANKIIFQQDYVHFMECIIWGMGIPLLIIMMKYPWRRSSELSGVGPMLDGWVYFSSFYISICLFFLISIFRGMKFY